MNNRLWIYLSDKAFDAETEKKISEEAARFLSGWNAHGKALTSSFEILHHHFIVIKADEKEYAASGCSIDKQFQFIKSIEQKYGIQLLNRLLVAYKRDNTVQITKTAGIGRLLEEKTLDENSIVFDLTIGTEEEFKNSFEVKMKDSWMKKFLLQNSHG